METAPKGAATLQPGASSRAVPLGAGGGPLRFPSARPAPGPSGRSTHGVPAPAAIAVAFGVLAFLKEPDTTLFWQALYDLGHVFIFALVMMLVDEGKVSLDDPMEKYLPEFQGQMLAVDMQIDRQRLAYPEEDAAQPLASPAMPQIPAEQVVAYVFTSGSTGLPQPHVKTWGALVRNTQAGAQCLGMDQQGHSIVGTVPPQHMYGFESTVLLALHARPPGGEPILVFDDRTGKQVDFDLRGSPEEVLARALPPAGPGRPRLGVVAREVTLLPRHWEWLAEQPGGASVTLRKLVEQARKTSAPADRARAAQDAAYRFASAMAGNEPGYEEAMRALYAGDAAAFDERTAVWPRDVRDHVRVLAADALAPAGEE